MMDKDYGEGSSKSPGKYSPIGYDDYLYSSDNEYINRSNQNKPRPGRFTKI